MGLSKIELIYKIILPTIAFISSIAVPLTLYWLKRKHRKGGGNIATNRSILEKTENRGQVVYIEKVNVFKLDEKEMMEEIRVIIDEEIQKLKDAFMGNKKI